MEKFDWKLTIKTNISILKIAGLWPSGNETYKFSFYSLYAFISILVFVYLHNFFQTFNIFYILDDPQAVIATIFVSLSELIGIFKTYCLIKNMKTLKQLMVTLNSDMFKPKNPRQRELVQSSLNSWKIVYRVLSTMGYIATSFFSLFPLLDTSEHRLPFLAWYPYDFKVSPFYELTYIHQVASVFFICIVNLNIDTLIAALNMYIGTQCDILCDDLRHIHEFSNVNEALINCVKHHRAILKFAESSNKFYNWILLAQFFTSAISIGMTMFQLTVIAALNTDLYSHLFYFNAVVVEIFMYCWFGNEVEIKSNKIPYAAFESNWSDASLEVKKNLLLLTLKSQKPIKVSVLNLFYLSLDTFMRILRTSWSYFTIARQVNA